MMGEVIVLTFNRHAMHKTSVVSIILEKSEFYVASKQKHLAMSNPFRVPSRQQVDANRRPRHGKSASIEVEAKLHYNICGQYLLTAQCHGVSSKIKIPRFIFLYKSWNKKKSVAMLGSFEFPHFSMFTLDRPTFARNRLCAFQVVHGFYAPAGRCSSSMVLRCTLTSRGI